MSEQKILSATWKLVEADVSLLQLNWRSVPQFQAGSCETSVSTVAVDISSSVENLRIDF